MIGFLERVKLTKVTIQVFRFSVLAGGSSQFESWAAAVGNVGVSRAMIRRLRQIIVARTPGTLELSMRMGTSTRRSQRMAKQTTKSKSKAVVLVPDGSGGMRQVQDNRFEQGDWPIRFDVPIDQAEAWLQSLYAECGRRNWHCGGIGQIGERENSGGITVNTSGGEQLTIIWERKRSGPCNKRWTGPSGRSIPGPLSPLASPSASMNQSRTSDTSCYRSNCDRTNCNELGRITSCSEARAQMLRHGSSIISSGLHSPSGRARRSALG